MRILYLHQYFRTPEEGGALRSYYLSQALVQAGHTVELITAFNGTEMNEPNVFRNLVASTAPDTEVTLTMRRDGREQQVRARLGELVSAPARDTEQPR